MGIVYKELGNQIQDNEVMFLRSVFVVSCSNELRNDDIRKVVIIYVWVTWSNSTDRLGQSVQMMYWDRQQPKSYLPREVLHPTEEKVVRPVTAHHLLH